MKRTIQQDHIAKGLCPRCGDEAAPYYLCAKHRFEGQLVRVLKRATAAGGLSTEKRGRHVYYTMANEAAWETVKCRPRAKEGDGRLRPRLGRIPVDVEAEIIGIMLRIGRPASIEEIISAWGRLRETRKHETASGDMAAIIRAQRRRDDRAAKRARMVAP